MSLATLMTLTYPRPSSLCNSNHQKRRREDAAPSPLPTSASPRGDSACSLIYILGLGASARTSADCVDAEHALRRRRAGDFWRQRFPGASSSPIASGLGAAERSGSVAA